jgi:hypothetical protein
LLMSISSGDGKEGDSAEYVLRNGMNEGMIWVGVRLVC